MKKLLFLFSFFWCFQVSGQVAFRLNDGSSIEFSEDDTSHFENAKLLSEFGFRVPSDLFRNLTEHQLEKLESLRARDFEMVNPEYQLFLDDFRLRPEEATEMRRRFIDDAAQGVMTLLEEKPLSQVRLLARDTNEIFDRIEHLLSPQEDDDIPVLRKKMDLYRRIRLIPASRPFIKKLISSPHAKQEILATLQISEVDIQKGSLILLDSGLEGTIPTQFSDHLREWYNSGKIEWRFLWRSPRTPPYVGVWPLGKFREWLDQRNLAEKFQAADKLDATSGLAMSFRVVALEHFPKWTGRVLEWKQEPSIVMLDLDDTVLKEVGLDQGASLVDGTNEEGGGWKVQSLIYQPGTDALKRYRERLEKRESDQGKVIHYEFLTPTQIRSTVLVRPAIHGFLKSLAPLISAGRIRLLVTSNNDSSRTQAVIAGLKVAGTTLKEMGAEFVDPQLFNTPDFKKSMKLLRRNLGISQDSTIIAIDDLPGNYILENSLDRVQSVIPFSKRQTENVMAQNRPYFESTLRDGQTLNRILETIIRSALVTEPVSIHSAIRAAAFALPLKQEPSSSSRMICHQLFAEVVAL